MTRSGIFEGRLQYLIQKKVKSVVVTFGESRPLHLAAMQSRKWVSGDDIVNELYEYKNLRASRNYVSSFASNIDDNIEKKAGMIFSTLTSVK